MGSVLASALITRAKTVLKDAGTTRRWPDTELLIWLNESQGQVCFIDPSVLSETIILTLEEGTKQAVPDGYSQVIEFYRNMGTDGATPGRGITVVDRADLDDAVPGWHSATASDVVLHAIVSDNDPSIFWVYPPQPAVPGDIEALCAMLPDPIPSVNDAITLDDSYEAVLLDLMLYRAFAKDADNSPAYAQRSTQHFNQAVVALGRNDMVVKAMTPGAAARMATEEVRG